MEGRGTTPFFKWIPVSTTTYALLLILQGLPFSCVTEHACAIFPECVDLLGLLAISSAAASRMILQNVLLGPRCLTLTKSQLVFILPVTQSFVINSCGKSFTYILNMVDHRHKGRKPFQLTIH